MRLLPKNALSRAFGRLCALRSPAWLVGPTVKWYARHYRIDESELAQPIAHFTSLGEFFVRDLKPDVRPQPGNADKHLLCPVDGKLRSVQLITGETLEQVKGVRYSLDALLGESSERFLGGIALNLYLSPANYHHVHSPLSGKIVKSAYISGTLWPVGNYFFERIAGLFCFNERLITWIQQGDHLYALAMIGATNVGKMTVAYDDWCTNQCRPKPEIEVRRYAEPRPIQAGDRLGTFHLGSSVVLLCPKGAVAAGPMSGTELPVRFGQSLGPLIM